MREEVGSLSSDHQFSFPKILELLVCETPRICSEGSFCEGDMSVLEKQARAFFHLSRFSKGSRSWKRCCRHASTSVAYAGDRKPYYVTTPIFYVNAGETTRSKSVAKPEYNWQLLTLVTCTRLFSRTFSSDGRFCEDTKTLSC
jgi:hypothetical protein